MTTIHQEYRRRHKISAITPITEGVLFLCNAQGNAQGIMTVNSSGRTSKSCDLCRRGGELILEVFVPNSYPHIYSVITHEHITPDHDLLDSIKKNLGNCEPYASKGDRDQEHWLWNFFIGTRICSGGSFQRVIREMFQRKDRLSELTWMDDMFWLAQNQSEIFNMFYSTLYSTCLINRKYLLMRDH